MRIRYLLIAFVIVCALSQTVHADNSTPSTSITKEIKNTHASKALIKDILLFLNTKEIQTQKLASIESSFSISDFPKEFWGIGISVYTTKGEKFSTVKAKAPIVTNALTGLHKQIHKKRNRRIIERIRLDFIIRAPWDIQYISLHQDDACIKKFSFGYDGVKVVDSNKKKFFFFPEDAFDENIHSASELVEKIKKHFNTQNLENLAYFKFRTQSYISFENIWFEIFKGSISNPEISPALINKVVHRIASQGVTALNDLANNKTIDYSSHGAQILPLLLYASIFNYTHIQNNVDSIIKILDKNLYKNILSKSDINHELLVGESKLASLLYAHSFLTEYKIITKKNTFDKNRNRIRKFIMRYFESIMDQKEKFSSLTLLTQARVLEFLTRTCTDKSFNTICKPLLENITRDLYRNRNSLVPHKDHQLLTERIIMESLKRNKKIWNSGTKNMSKNNKNLRKAIDKILASLVERHIEVTTDFNGSYIKNFSELMKKSKNVPTELYVSIQKHLTDISISKSISSQLRAQRIHLDPNNSELLAYLLYTYYR